MRPGQLMAFFLLNNENEEMQQQLHQKQAHLEIMCYIRAIPGEDYDISKDIDVIENSREIFLGSPQRQYLEQQQNQYGKSRTRRQIHLDDDDDNDEVDKVYHQPLVPSSGKYFLQFKIK